MSKLKIVKTLLILRIPDCYEIQINGKLIFSRHQLGVWPDTAEIVEISKWGNKGKSFLHMYLCR